MIVLTLEKVERCLQPTHRWRNRKKIRGRAAGRIWTLPPSVLKGANAHSMGFVPFDGWIHPHMARNPAGIRALQNR
jgi:hypothetical protein